MQNSQTFGCKIHEVYIFTWIARKNHDSSPWPSTTQGADGRVKTWLRLLVWNPTPTTVLPPCAPVKTIQWILTNMGPAAVRYHSKDDMSVGEYKTSLFLWVLFGWMRGFCDVFCDWAGFRNVQCFFSLLWVAFSVRIFLWSHFRVGSNTQL